MGSNSQRSFRVVFVPWVMAAIVIILSAVGYPLVYGYGKRVGDLEARYDEMASRMPPDFRLIIALLAGDHSHLSENELISVRGRLRGTISFATGMVIPMERERGHQERVAELERLVKQGQEIDERLGPIYPDSKAAPANAESRRRFSPSAVQVERLLKQGRDLDKQLGPMYPGLGGEG